MHIFNTRLLVAAIAALGMVSIFASTPVSAETPAERQARCQAQFPNNPESVERCVSGQSSVTGNPSLENRSECPDGQIETSFIWGGKRCIAENRDNASTTNNPIYIVLIDIMRFLSALVGIAVAGGIIYGGILWSTAAGNSGQVSKATTVIFNSILGLIIYILMFAIINFLVPGGLFQ